MLGLEKLSLLQKLKSFMKECVRRETIIKHFPLFKLAHEKGKAIIKFERTLQISILKKTSELKR